MSDDKYSTHQVQVNVISRGGDFHDFHAPAPAVRECKPQPPVPASQARRRAEAKRALAAGAAALDELRDGDLTLELADLLGDVMATGEDVLSRYER